MILRRRRMARKKLAAQWSRYPRTYKGIGAASVTFFGKGGMTEWYEKSPRKAWAF